VSSVFGRLLSAIEAEQPVAVAKVIAAPSGLGTQLLVPHNGPAEGDFAIPDLRPRVESEARELLARLALSQTRKYEPDVEVFFDVYLAPPTLLLFGAVHVGAALCRLASAIGFRVKVVDARGFFATKERFPDASEIAIAHADDYLAQHPIGPNTYVAVLSHDPKLDDPALFAAVNSPARYIGAVGSRKTHAERLQRLRERGVTDEQLRRIHGGPVGLDIGAVTPEEIALSILGQVVAAKNGQESPPISLKEPA